MRADFGYRVRGEYKLIRRKAVTAPNGERVPGPVVGETPWTKNLLTLTYFNNAMAVGALRVKGMVVGTGTTAPSEEQSSLASYLAQTTTRQSFSATINAVTSPRSVTKEWRFRFGEGVAAGNVAEVGMIDNALGGGITSATPVSSRARLTDSSGNPTTVTVLSDEFLDVIWRFTVYVPEDVTGSAMISIDGVPTEYNYVIRGIGMSPGGGYNSWWDGETIGVAPTNGINSPSFDPVASTDDALYAYTATGPQTSGTQGTFSTEPYTPNSKNRTLRITWGLNNANIAIRSIFAKSSRNDSLVYMMGQYQILLDKPITKTNLKTLMLRINIALDNA